MSLRSGGTPPLPKNTAIPGDRANPQDEALVFGTSTPARREALTAAIPALTAAGDNLEPLAEVVAAQERGDVLLAYDLAMSALERGAGDATQLRYHAVLALARSGGDLRWRRVARDRARWCSGSEHHRLSRLATAPRGRPLATAS